MMPRGPALALAAALAVLCACVVRVPAPELPAPAREPRADWGRVLAEVPRRDGRIDLEALRADPRDLERTVAWLASTSPDSDPERFPSDAERLAYWLNAYAALGLHAVVGGGEDPRNGARLRSTLAFRVGGRWLTLGEIAADRARPLADARVWLALSDPGPWSPDPPAEPFEAARVEAQLDDRARAFFDSPRHARLRPEVGAIELSRVFEAHLDDFLADTPDLIEYVNRFRTRRIPGNVFVRFQSAPGRPSTAPGSAAAMD